MLFNSNNYLEAVGINSILGILVFLLNVKSNVSLLPYTESPFHTVTVIEM